MSLNHPTQGEGYVGAYQLSSTPFVTSSTISQGAVKEIDFNYVSRFIHVKNNTAGTVLALAFTANGLTPTASNYLLLSGSETFSAELRLVKLFLSGVAGTSSFTMLAGLTTIPEKNFLPVTASSGYGGVG